jgi:Flp pilus assembly protein TadG
MKSIRHIGRCERGAIVVQVSVAMLVLMAFNVFVIDYGVMWISRRQAQNAADAGALAGGVALNYDDVSTPSTGVAAAIATQVAQSNLVWQQAGVATASLTCPAGVTGRCVRVDVYRDGAHSNQIPMLFGPILGMTSQGVQASATATAGIGNTTTCLRPIALPDGGFFDNRAPNGEFNHYAEPGGALLANPDVYISPSSAVAGATTISGGYGLQINWLLDTPLLTTPIARRPVGGSAGLESAVVPLALGGVQGVAAFNTNMQTCNGTTISLGDTIDVNTAMSAGTVETAVGNLYSLDSGATYDSTNNRIVNSCAPNCGGSSLSPRFIAIALYDPDQFQLGRATSNWVAAGCASGTPCITVRNIVGFFVHCVNGVACPGADATPHGHFLRYPGSRLTAPPTYTEDASWLASTNLIR